MACSDGGERSPGQAYVITVGRRGPWPNRAQYLAHLQGGHPETRWSPRLLLSIYKHLKNKFLSLTAAMNIRQIAEESDPQSRSYPLISRSIQRAGKPPNLLLTKPGLNSDCVNPNLSGGVDDLEFDRRLAISSSWCQGSADDLVNDYSHPFNWLSDVPDWVPITFYSSGSNPTPLKMPANDPSKFASGSDTFRQAHRPRSLLDIAVPSPAASELTPALPPHLGPTFITTDSPTSSSLHQLLIETTTDNILTVPAGIPGQSKSDAKQLADEHALNPFLPLAHSDIMFPSLGSVIDNLLEDKSAPKLGLDTMGRALLPPSEFTFALESDCNFHYQFWDGFLEYVSSKSTPLDTNDQLDLFAGHSSACRSVYPSI